ncbi:MAG: phosphoribosylamine--glycine ligase [Candidatus Hydrogenedentes bacterium]|nr:phosphoribosylamine--glycine ligase [Candidatus Hydrogenedentota bacterium]
MNVLVIGGGGREHALVWKIAQSPLVQAIYCAPGNPGIGRLAECVKLKARDFEGLARFAREKDVGLTVVGPEDPLAAGIADHFASAGLRVFGPSASAARLEGSKSFAKAFMKRHKIPTAEYAEFDTADAAVGYVRKKGAPIVVKADGLAAGKGVTVARDVAGAEAAIREAMVDGAFGDAGSRVVIEECMEGEEASVLAFCDGRTFAPMIPSQDHKPALDGDAGPNTGGMGAYAPAPVASGAVMEDVARTVLRPVVEGMAEEGAPYRGVLYAGLMIGPAGARVVEINCRFGDPETQVVLPLMTTDIVPVMLACCEGTLAQAEIEWSPGACVSVVMASGGYPREYEKGKVICGIKEAEEEEGVIVFHAGTAERDGQLVTNGGRVLNVTATGPDIASTIEKAYRGVRRITFEGAHFRTDIGKKAIDRPLR